MVYLPLITEFPREVEITIPFNGDSLLDLNLWDLDLFYTVEIVHKATGKVFNLPFDIYEKTSSYIVLNLHFDELVYIGQYDLFFKNTYSGGTYCDVLLEILGKQPTLPKYNGKTNVTTYSTITEIIRYKNDNTLIQ